MTTTTLTTPTRALPMLLLAALSSALLTCKSKDEDKARLADPVSPMESALKADEPSDPAMNAAAAVSMDEAEEDFRRGDGGKDKKVAEKSGVLGAIDGSYAQSPAADGFGSGAGQETGVRSRSWFPETFLFEPLIVTDERGSASVDVTVPDRLTSWRVLALAHSRTGSAAGASTEFLGTLPAYVDPIVPARLRVGDEVRIPIQLVNTTAEPIATDLTVSVSGGTIAAPPRRVTIPASGSTVLYASLVATEIGSLRLAATLGGTDSVVRTAEVIPVGKRVDETRSATLAAPRALTMTGPAGGERGAHSDRVRLEVFPGALAIVRSELGVSGERGGVAADAFALLLAGRAPELLARLGDEPDVEALRTMTILSTQRVVRHARVLGPESASLLAEAALAHPQNPILSAIGQRAVAYLEINQLPDGTCGGETGWTLQRLLVATADCARAAKSAPGVVARASGAFERHGKQVTDPYTAAAILAAKAAPDEVLANALIEMVVAAVEKSESGAAWIKVPDGVVRADGIRPSALEASALAALALGESPEHKSLVADLGATVIAGYSRRRGWGDGRANLVATEALVTLFANPIPDKIDISLTRDGEPIASGALNAANIRDVLTLTANNVGAAGKHEWRVVAEPAVAGLGFNLELSSWVPWPPQSRELGLEISAPTPAGLAVGRVSQWRIEAAAPTNAAFTVRLEVPAGVQIERERLDQLTAAGVIARYDLDDDQLTVHVASVNPGQSFAMDVAVIPTLAGAIQSGPQTIVMDGVSVANPPSTWRVK